MSADKDERDRFWLRRIKDVAVAVMLTITLVLPGYMASYDTIKAADEFSPALIPLGAFAFALLWAITLLCTIRAVVKLYALRLEHPGWRATFEGLNTALESTISQYTTVKMNVDTEAMFKPYFLLPITKAGLLRLDRLLLHDGLWLCPHL
ncbi:hypothetical protein [Bradyrhizobium elkanii]|uniref:hypothetical protein n=1 Tax=Bradyrhizobium elkanii TaxID=29448 RepID=UPI001BAC5B34|nr:hypothetical protein [Bradyrhizobium elkanii]MBR1164624.1 hypothetical protein [Bradyrhizobium elkanii]